MKIVSWNCTSKFREKYTSIIEEDADIYVLCECEDHARDKLEDYIEFAEDNYYWTGTFIGTDKFKQKTKQQRIIQCIS